MARAELQFPPARLTSRNYEPVLGNFGEKWRLYVLQRIAGLAFAAAIAVAPAAFAQRPSAPSGGGSHASASPGGGASWGGSRSSGGFGGVQHYSGGGGWRGTSGGAGRSGGNVRWGRANGRAASSRGTGSRGVENRTQSRRSGFAGGSRAPRFQPFGSRGMERSQHARETGFRATLRRWFGNKTGVARSDGTASGADRLTDAMVARDVQEASLPPVFTRVKLNSFPAFERLRVAERNSAMITTQPALRRSPTPPFPLRFRPVAVSGAAYWYWPDFDLGFPFFFDFNYVNCCGWLSYGQRNVLARPALLLYLKDGSALEVTDYWVDGITLHYRMDDGRTGSVAVANVDIPRTTHANRRVGLQFRLDRTQPGLPLDRVKPGTGPDQQNGPNQSISLPN